MRCHSLPLPALPRLLRLAVLSPEVLVVLRISLRFTTPDLITMLLPHSERHGSRLYLPMLIKPCHYLFGQSPPVVLTHAFISKAILIYVGHAYRSQKHLLVVAPFILASLIKLVVMSRSPAAKLILPASNTTENYSIKLHKGVQTY